MSNAPAASAAPAAPAADDNIFLADAAATTEGAQPEAAPAKVEGETPAPAGEKPEAAPAKVEAKGEDEGAKGDEPKQGAPDAYEDFAMPEGVTLDPAVADDLKAVAKDLNLTQEQAQRLADLGAKQAQRFVESQLSAIAAASAAWVEQVRNDPDLGGDNLRTNLAVANKALTTFGSPELRALLKDSKLANHPEVVRLFWKVGQTIKEDRVVPGGRAAADTAGKPLAERLYPSN